MHTTALSATLPPRPCFLGFNRTSQSKIFSSNQCHVSRQSMCHRRAPIIATVEFSEQFRGIMTPAMGGQLTVGSLLGFATGYAIKRVGQAVLVLVGLQIISLQLMDQRGWVIVNWSLIGQDLAPRVKGNEVDRFINAIRIKAPFAGGFTAGCYAGFRWS